MLNDDNISLHHLRVLSLVLRERNLTRVAQTLHTTQSSISKNLARLRAHFGDPLFVRVGLTMQPTPKAAQLDKALNELLVASDLLRLASPPFDPATSDRDFRLILSDVGMVRFLPPLASHLEKQGSRLRLTALALETKQVDGKLESGEADIALGAFRNISTTMRNQRLYTDFFVSMARRAHPRLKYLTASEGFFAERHVLVTDSNMGHDVHQIAQQALEKLLPANKIHLRLPSFMAAALVASRTDALVTMPSNLAKLIESDFGLAIFCPPLALPKIEIAQFWHERYHLDPGHRWIRSTIHRLFSDRKPK
jgi:DNA-binding transcriptional LysR family regulator